MIRAMLERLRERLEGMHQDQGGAVAIMCLAACLILFMIGLVLYDTGTATRDKIQNLTASDAAAYSNAAVKARTMNMIMYTNVAKRHVAASVTSYFAAYAAYAAWIAQRCSKCCKWPWCWQACWDCASNGVILTTETLADTIRHWAGRFDQVLDELDKYQLYMARLTPWWAYMESMGTGTRNGSSLVTSFPPLPDSALTGIPDLVNGVVSIIRGFGLYPQTYRKDTIPIKQSGWICLDAAYLMILIEDPTSIFELEWYISQNRSRSSGAPPLATKGPRNFADSYRNPIWGGIGCAMAFLSSKGRAQEPNLRDGWSNSNLIFAYKGKEATNKADRDKYKYMSQEYRTDLGRFDKPSGYWALARSEYFAKGGAHRWRANWTARLKPIDPMQYSLNAMYHDVLPFFAIQGLFGLLTGLDFTTMLNDMVFFEKASRSMDLGNQSGFFR